MRRLLAPMPDGWGIPPRPAWAVDINVVGVDGVLFAAAYVFDDAPQSDADWSAWLSAAAAGPDPTRRAVANEAHVDDRLTQAIAANKTYLALSPPTNAQVVAQVRSITRQLVAIEKKLLRDLADTDDT